MPDRIIGPGLRSLRWLATALAVVLLIPFWWLLPGLGLGWHLGGRSGRQGGDRWLAALPLGFALPCLVLPAARLAQLPWKEVWLALAAVTLGAGVLRAVRTARPAGPSLTPWPALALAAAALGVLYAWPMRGLVAPPGIDMSMHLTFARLLWQQTAVPFTQAPIFPGVPLGAYPLGFHALTALTAMVTGNILVAGLLTAAATHALVPIALYLCCRRRDDASARRGPDGTTAAAALLIAWIARDPQAYVSWGGNPCVLGTALAFVAARALLVPAAGSRGVPAVEAGLLAAAVALVHPTPAAMLAYVVAGGLPVLAWLGVVRLDRGRWRHLAAAGLVAVVILLPQLPAIRGTAMAPHEVAWVRENHRLPPQAPEAGVAGAVRFLNGQYGDTMVILFAVLVVVGFARHRSWRRPAVYLGTLLAVFALASFAARWWLPPALALYPERMMLFALPVFVCALRDATAGWRPGRRGVLPIAATVGGLALAGLAVAKHQQFYHRKVRDDVFVTLADARAFAWLARQAAPAAVVDNNYGDAGVFIPAATGLAVTRPQTNPIWFDEMHAFQAQTQPQYRFHGARRIAGDDSTGCLIAPPDVVHTERDAGAAATIARVPSSAEGATP